jgi:NAD-dependent DNA ligase
MMLEGINIETTIMAHRYLYYVLSEPVLPDFDYDMLEREARLHLPETSPVHAVGSSLPSSYTTEQIALAELLRGT